MMSSKFYVWTGGRWCEVCPVTGRVRRSGWRGKARFVFVRKGRLCIARSHRVLRGLQDLAAGEPTSVRDDVKLEKRRKKWKKRAQCSGCRHSCCPTQDNSAKDVVKSVQETNLDVAVQSEPRIEPVTIPSKPMARERLRCPSPSGTHTSLHDINEHYRELVIDETEVNLYRSFLIKHNPNFDLLRFDSDENYKLKIFYKMNPLVAIERCTQLENMIRVSPCSQDTLSLKDFATKLGLQSISDHEMEMNKRYKMRSRKKETVDDMDKENRLQNNENKYKEIENNAMNKILEAVKRNISKDKDIKQETRKKKQESQKMVPGPPVPPIKMHPIKFKSANVPKVYNGYSNLEDHAIVAWVSGGRSRLVNGNRIWRELQNEFVKLTGVQRTFHSLRNRYLRYLLPSLQTLALCPRQAAQLRADAAAGEIKSRKKTEPYPFEYPRVVSAWSVRDKDKDSSPLEDSETQVDKDVSARESKISKSPQKSLNTSQNRKKSPPNQFLSSKASKRNESPNKSRKESPIRSTNKKKSVRRNESPFRSGSSKNTKKIESPSKSRKQSLTSSSSNNKPKSSRQVSPKSRKESPHDMKTSTRNRITSPLKSKNHLLIPSTNNHKSSSYKNVSPNRSQKQSPVKSHSKKKFTSTRTKSPLKSRNQSPIISTSNNNVSPNRSQSKRNSVRIKSSSPTHESHRSRRTSFSESPVRKSRNSRKPRKNSSESFETPTTESRRSSRSLSSDSLESFQKKLRNISTQDTQKDSPRLRGSARETRKSPSLLRPKQLPHQTLERNRLGRFVKRASLPQKRSRSSSSSAVRVVKKQRVRAVSISSNSSGQFEGKREGDRSKERTARDWMDTSKDTQSEAQPTTAHRRRPRTRKLYNHNVRPH